MFWSILHGPRDGNSPLNLVGVTSLATHDVNALLTKVYEFIQIGPMSRKKMPAETSYVTTTVSYCSDTPKPIDLCSVQLDSFEAISADCKVRFTFKETPKLADMVSDEFRDEILHQLLTFEKIEGILSKPDHVFDTENLVLRRLSIFGRDRGNGNKVITLRWSQFVGSIFSVFKLKPEFLVSHGPPNSRLAFEVLDTILQPIFDLTKIEKFPSSDTGQSEAIVKMLDDFKEKRDELEKYAVLLRTYISHEMQSLSDREPEAPSQSNRPRYLC